MKTIKATPLKTSTFLIVGLILLTGNLCPPGVKFASAQNAQERLGRERAMDRIVHIEEGIIRDIPQVPRLCDSMEIEKGKIDIGGYRSC